MKLTLTRTMSCSRDYIYATNIMELCLPKLLNPLLNPNSKHRTLGCCALSPVLVLVTIGAASGGLADDKAAAWMSYTRGGYCPSNTCLDLHE